MLQVKFLLVGLLLAAGFVGYQWLGDLPTIPPVRLPATPGSAPLDAETRDDAQFGASAADGFVAATGEESQDEGLPSLNDSDDWLRERLAATALPWLAESELVRTSATVLANAAEGKVPRKFVEFLAPEGEFTVIAQSGRLGVDPASYARYDPFVASLTSLAPARAAAVFELVEPLLAEALRELGGDASGVVASPRELAYEALEVALATPMGTVDAALVRPKVIYKYADESLEKLAPLQKQLLRMGPDNLRKVRFWLEDFGAQLVPGVTPALDISETAESAATGGPFVLSDG